MEDNKPNQTDPSVNAAPADDKSAPAIQERLANAINQQKTSDNPIEPVVADKKPEGGTGSDVTSTQKDSSQNTDPNTEVLKLIQASTGRSFTDVDEAKKYLSNLNSLVGDNSVAKARESAKLYDTLVSKFAGEKGISVDEAKKFWADTLTQETVKPVQKPQPAAAVVDDKTSNEVEQLKTRLDRADLVAKYPFAKQIQDEIAIVAKQKGISQIEAFEQSPFKSLLEKQAEDESKKSPVVTPSNRTGFDQKKVQEQASRVLKTGNEDDKVALVTEMLGDLVR